MPFSNGINSGAARSMTKGRILHTSNHMRTRGSQGMQLASQRCLHLIEQIPAAEGGNQCFENQRRKAKHPLEPCCAVTTGSRTTLFRKQTTQGPFEKHLAAANWIPALQALRQTGKNHNTLQHKQKAEDRDKIWFVLAAKSLNVRDPGGTSQGRVMQLHGVK
jgi:hypothetical protein